jgi:hypothetical protein
VPETGEERKPPNIFNIHKEASSSSTEGSSNLRPQGVRTSGLVPHVLSKPAKPAAAAAPSAAATAAPSAAAAGKVTAAGDDSDSDEEDLLG